MKAFVAIGESDILRLTPRQLAVARLAAEGLSRREIAQRLGITPATVDHHAGDVIARTNARSLLHAIVMLLRQRVIE